MGMNQTEHTLENFCVTANDIYRNFILFSFFPNPLILHLFSTSEKWGRGRNPKPPLSPVYVPNSGLLWGKLH